MRFIARPKEKGFLWRAGKEGKGEGPGLIRRRPRKRKSGAPSPHHVVGRGGKILYTFWEEEYRGLVLRRPGSLHPLSIPASKKEKKKEEKRKYGHHPSCNPTLRRGKKEPFPSSPSFRHARLEGKKNRKELAIKGRGGKEGKESSFFPSFRAR